MVINRGNSMRYDATVQKPDATMHVNKRKFFMFSMILDVFNKELKGNRNAPLS